MQNIHVRRYHETQGTSYQGCIEPEDKSWVVFIDKYGEATFWRRTQPLWKGKPPIYVDVELPVNPAILCGDEAIPPEEGEDLSDPLSEEELRLRFEALWGRVPTSDIGDDARRQLFEENIKTKEGRARLCESLGVPVKWPVPEGNPFDFTIEPSLEPAEMDVLGAADRKREAEIPNRKQGFLGRLNCRSVMVWGETEHEVARKLIWLVAELCTAGSLDHTGRPSNGNARRRKATER